ncbi:hypothetical protein VB264_00145 [Arcicella aquatica]|uniref:Outer membrane protein beta-barrel domain-containing protein n=1 Tax=Arcicella aquatica TaxID=217141 RepID=A0ABU5QGJ0_9BACT|nr:hypothetical protein [Arcicella aquatica]MEA5256172.1 hypothetical protein [Arcicella aquatica]
MSALDKDKDPFEDLFRDNLFDFESEPNDKLWKAIEPQLPANPARKIPYWQFAAVAVLLLLTGIGVYLLPSKMNNDSEAKIEQPVEKFVNSQKEAEKSIEENKHSNVETNKPDNIAKDLPTEDISTLSSKNIAKNPTDATNSNELAEESVGISSKINTAKLGNISKKEAITVEKEAIVSYKKQVVSKAKKGNKTDTGEVPPITPTDNHQSELSGAGDQQGNAINNNTQKYSFNKSNTKGRSAVFSDRTNNTINDNAVSTNNQLSEVAGSRFKMLSALDSKEYHPFSNHFRTPKIRYRGPKPTVYFKESKPLEWYVSAMPLINYYTITANGNDANYVHQIAVNDDADRLGFYTQAGLVFTLSDRFKLRTGLTFTKTNHSFSYQVRTDSLVVQSPDNTGVDVSFAEIKKVYSQSAYYLGTKVELQYTFLRGESLSHYVNVGVEGAYKINGSNQFNGFANIVYGITRQIGDNAYLFIEPTFSYSLNQQSDSNSLLLIKPNKIGFNIGINFKLR